MRLADGIVSNVEKYIKNKEDYLSIERFIKLFDTYFEFNQYLIDCTNELISKASSSISMLSKKTKLNVNRILREDKEKTKIIAKNVLDTIERVFKKEALSDEKRLYLEIRKNEFERQK